MYPGSWFRRCESEFTHSINNIRDRQSPCGRPLRYFIVSVSNVSLSVRRNSFVVHFDNIQFTALISFSGTFANFIASSSHLCGIMSNAFL